MTLQSRLEQYCRLIVAYLLHRLACCERVCSLQIVIQDSIIRLVSQHVDNCDSPAPGLNEAFVQGLPTS